MGFWSNIFGTPSGSGSDGVDTGQAIDATVNTVVPGAGAVGFVASLFGPSYTASGGGEIRRQLTSSNWAADDIDYVVNWSRTNRPDWYNGTGDIWEGNGQLLYRVQAEYRHLKEQASQAGSEVGKNLPAPSTMWAKLKAKADEKPWFWAVIIGVPVLVVVGIVMLIRAFVRMGYRRAKGKYKQRPQR